jgi:hypothetical protein
MDLAFKVRRATSKNTRFQLTTDGLDAYVIAVDEIPSDRCDFADSGGCRSAFRTDVDHRSEVMPISVPNSCRSVLRL